MKSLKEKINEILEGDFDVHHIFKEIVSKQSAFTENEEIIDLIFIKRKHLDERDSKSAVQSPAKLIVATTHGLVFAVEGFKEITENYYGYRMKHIYYDKISSLELDICLLQGEFKVVANSTENPEILVNFNAAIYYQEFEKFVESVRQKRIEYDY
jgi:hypothetical protein